MKLRSRKGCPKGDHYRLKATATDRETGRQLKAIVYLDPDSRAMIAMVRGAFSNKSGMSHLGPLTVIPARDSSEH